MLQYAATVPSPMPVTPDAMRDAHASADIETARARLRTIGAGRDIRWPVSYVYPFCGHDEDMPGDGWRWEASGEQGQSLGFLGLVPGGSVGGPDGVFGPMLRVALKRDLAPGLGTEIIAALMAWLARRQICHVVHASHGEADVQLARWLDLAGFLYTGRREADGARSMILVL